jgi:hypothetical protein
MPDSSSLYDQDFVLWSKETARAITEGRWSDIDRAALADEVESLGKHDRREAGGRLAVIVTHMLKLKYQPQKQQTRNRRVAITEQQDRLALVLNDSPSLRAQLPELLATYYRSARRKAAWQTKLRLDTFPETCEWSVEQVLGV